MGGFMSTQEFIPCLLYLSCLFAGGFVSRNYPESDLQGGVKLWRALSLFAWAPLRLQRREVSGGQRSDPDPPASGRGFRRPLGASPHPKCPAQLQGCREGLAASGEPQLCARFHRSSKRRQNRATLFRSEVPAREPRPAWPLPVAAQAQWPRPSELRPGPLEGPGAAAFSRVAHEGCAPSWRRQTLWRQMRASAPRPQRQAKRRGCGLCPRAGPPASAPHSPTATRPGPVITIGPAGQKRRPAWGSWRSASPYSPTRENNRWRRHREAAAVEPFRWPMARLRGRAQQARSQAPPPASSGLGIWLLNFREGHGARVAAHGILPPPALHSDLAPVRWPRPLPAPSPQPPGQACPRRPGCAARWVVGRRQPQARPTARPRTKGKRSSTPRTCWKHLFQSRFCICSVRNNA